MSHSNRRKRRGQVSLEASLSLVITFSIGMVALGIAIQAFRHLYQIIATIIAGPYI